MRQFLIFFIFVFSWFWNLQAQEGVIPRYKQVFADRDTVFLDSLSILPGSLVIEGVSPSQYSVDCIHGYLFLHDTTLYGKTLNCHYKLFHKSFAHRVYNKPISLIQEKGKFYKPEELNLPASFLLDYSSESQLERSGSITRGVTVGNNQDFVLNSSLNLQVSGYLAPEVELRANITDRTLPIQPEGNTRTIQEFDKIFITLDIKKKLKVKGGDIDIVSPESYFLKIGKKNLGLEIEALFSLNNKGTVKTRTGAGISKGKYYKQRIVPQNGRQGPYKLTGNVGEGTITVLYGSERVYIDNRLLTRGKDEDYVIDYNLGEIIFTPKILITGEKEIHVEYEYSDLAYSRYTLHTFNEIGLGEKDQFKVTFNFFQEEDMKNNSIQPQLTDSMKLMMSQLYNETTLLYPGAVLSNYFPGEPLYIQVDTVVDGTTYTIYQQSTNSDEVLYRLNFSYLGVGKGNYKLNVAATNGRAFVWVPPMNGIPQGEYEPVIQLQTPQRYQIGTLGVQYKGLKHFTISSEFVFSNLNQNLFSNRDSNSQIGIAYHLLLQYKDELFKHKEESKRWIFNSLLGYEVRSARFLLLEENRDIEFNKNYNIDDQTTRNKASQMGTLDLSLSNKRNGSMQWKSELFQVQKQLLALRNGLNTNLKWNRLRLTSQTSHLLNHDLLIHSNFFRTQTQLSMVNRKTELGIYDRTELNRLTDQKQDTLVGNSYRYNELALFFKNNDTLQFKYLLQIKNIFAHRAVQNKFLKEKEGYEFQTAVEYAPTIKQSIKTTLTYRNEQLFDSLQQSFFENLFVGGINYLGRFLNNGVIYQANYEAGSGMEQKKVFSYLKVAPGQGTHIWNDYNNNGVEELDEFEVAVFQNEADYIRIWIPSHDYYNTYNTELTQMLQIRPKQIWRNPKNRFVKIVTLFSNHTTFKIGQKTQTDSFFSALNPFSFLKDDADVENCDFNLNNRFLFQSPSQKWIGDYIYKQLYNKNNYYYGTETVNLKMHEWSIRYKVTRFLILKSGYQAAVKENSSQFFHNKNFTIETHNLKLESQIQHSEKINLILKYDYKFKINLVGKEEVSSHEVETEFYYRMVKKGMLQINLKYAYLKPNQDIVGNLAYEIMEGQTKGSNWLWSVIYQTKLVDYLFLDLQYNGRKGGRNRMIHTGSLQIKFLF